MEIITIIAAILCAAALTADVLTTANNNGHPNIREENAFFADENGDAKIGKLIIWKVILFAIISAVVYFLYFKTGDGAKLAFMVYAGAAFINALTAFRNWKLKKKYDERLYK